MSPMSVSECRSRSPLFFFRFLRSVITLVFPRIFWSSSLFKLRGSPFASFLIYSSVNGIPFHLQMSQISSSVSPRLFPFRNASISSFVSLSLFFGSLRSSLISSFVRGTPFSFLPNNFAISLSVSLIPCY